MRFSGIISSVLVLFLAIPSVFAQKEAEDVRVPVGSEASPLQPPSEQLEVQQARQLMRRKQWAPASALLELAYERNRKDPVVYNLLKTCYVQLSYFTKAELLANRMVNFFPQSFRYHQDLGEILALQGKNDRAREAYREALKLVKEVNPAYRGTIIDNMIENHLEDAALNVIESERDATGDSALFALQKGTIHESRREYRKAALEFLTIVDDTSSVAINAEKKLSGLLEFPESSDVTEQLMLTWVDSVKSESLFRTLSNYYLKSGRYDRAFEYARVQDSLGELGGRYLVRHMRTCHDRGLYTQASEVGDYLLARYPKGPFIIEVLNTYADSRRGMGQPYEAIDIYDTLVSIIPRPRDKTDAMYRIGQIYLDDLNKPDSALIYFDSIITNFQLGYGVIMARIAVPYCFLRQGNLDAAKARFSSIANMQMNPEQAEEVDFNLAMIDFYQKNLDSAEAAMRKLIVDYPRGYYVNDALRLLVLMGDATDAPELMYDFSNALLFQERRMLDSSKVKLMSLVEAENPVLADVALYELAQLSLDQADTTVTEIYIERLENEYPDSYYVPYALKMKADMLMPSTTTRDEAIQIYRTLLQKYPKYPFISEVRSVLREIELDSQIG